MAEKILYQAASPGYEYRPIRWESGGRFHTRCGPSQGKSCLHFMSSCATLYKNFCINGPLLSRWAAIWEAYLRQRALAVDNIRMLINGQSMIGGFLQQFMAGDDFRLLSRCVEGRTAFPASFVQGLHAGGGHLLCGRLYADDFLRNIDAIQEREGAR